MVNYHMTLYDIYDVIIRGAYKKQEYIPQ
jgi:hypothetical protein